jgi:nucleoside phosphorylase
MKGRHPDALMSGEAVPGPRFGDRLLVMPTWAEYRAVEHALDGWSDAGSFDLALCGIGPANSAGFCRRLDAEGRRPGFLILLGYGGGLAPDLLQGDLLVADAALDEMGHRSACLAVSLPGARIGPLLTVSAPLLTPAAKAARRTTGAMAVEMEAYPLAEWAVARHVPFAHVRVILDPHDATLPDAGEAFDPFGAIRPANLLLRLARHPGEVRPFLRLARLARSLAPTLGSTARALVALNLPSG